MGQKTIQIGDRIIGNSRPTYIIAEIGINHNGSLEIAKKLIDSAASSDCDAVKFQKRTSHLCVPAQQQGVMKQTPWGTMTYLEYRDRVEFNEAEYREIDRYCKKRASCGSHRAGMNHPLISWNSFPRFAIRYAPQPLQMTISSGV